MGQVQSLRFGVGAFGEVCAVVAAAERCCIERHAPAVF